MKIPEDHIFLDNINLSRIAAPINLDQLQQEIDETIKKVGEHKYLREYLQLRYPQLVEFSILSPIIRQIIDNLLLNNYWAAVTLTNFLFESTIKFALVYLDCEPEGHHLDEIHKKSLLKYSDNELVENINRCKTIGILTKKDAERLKLLTNRFRNPFSHADLSQVAKTSSIDTMHLYTMTLNGKGELVDQIINWKDTPIMLFQYTNLYLQTNANEYFLTIMHYVDIIDFKITQKIKTQNL